MRDRVDLMQRQALPLEAKILMSQSRIREWYNYWSGDVYISFSGGKDSTVLAHLVHDIYPGVPIIFSNTGLEYPEIQSFAKVSGAEFIYPAMNFIEVVKKYGYPLISKEVAEAIYIARRVDDHAKKWRDSKRMELLGKRVTEDGRKSPYNKEKWLPLCYLTDFKISHWCCSIMKKQPFKKLEKDRGIKPFIGSLAEESKLRELSWLQHGCNAFDCVRKVSNPLSFWREQDILEYIEKFGLKIADVYGKIIHDECGYRCSGVDRTGCIFCGFSVHLDREESKFQRLAKTHPKQYKFCMEGGEYIENPDFVYGLETRSGEWINWNPRRIWVPNKVGLGLRHVFSQVNEIYGEEIIKY